MLYCRHSNRNFPKQHNTRGKHASDIYLFFFTIYIAELQINISFYSKHKKMVVEVFSHAQLQEATYCDSSTQCH